MKILKKVSQRISSRRKKGKKGGESGSSNSFGSSSPSSSEESAAHTNLFKELQDKARINIQRLELLFNQMMTTSLQASLLLVEDNGPGISLKEKDAILQRMATSLQTI